MILQIINEGNFLFRNGYLGKPSVSWLYVASDLIITLSYLSISLLLFYFLRQRPNIPFQKILWLLSAFIMVGGLTKLMELWMLWCLDYGLLGLFIVGIVALFIAGKLVQLILKALQCQSFLEMQVVHQSLVEEIQEYRQAASEVQEFMMCLVSLFLTNHRGTENTEERVLRREGGGVFGWLGNWQTDANQPLVELRQVIAELQSEIAQRQRIEASLREREEQYRSVVDNVKEVIFQTDVHGYWTFLNPAWSCITGFAIADSIGTLFLDYVHPDDRQCNLEEVCPLIEGKKEFCCHEVRYRTKSGGYRWIEVFAQLTFDGNGEISGTCGTLHDITERHLNEAALKASESRYRAIVEDQTEIICRFLPDGTITFVNEAYCSYFGKCREDLIGHHFVPLMPEQDAQLVKMQLAALNPENPVATYEYQVVTSQGEIRTLTRTHRAIFDEQGNLIEFQAVGRDITERKQAEAALRESEARFRSLVAHIPGVVYHCAYDAERTVEFISDVIEEISGYPAADFLHNQVRTLASLISPQDRARVDQTISECVSQRQPYVMEYRIVRSDGSVRWVYEKGQGVFSADDGLLWLDGVIFDITDYRQTQEELRLREEQFRQLTENIHEVFFLTTPDVNQMLYISPAYEEVWGRSTQSLYESPKSWLDSVHPEDRHRVIAALRQHLQNKHDFEEEYRIVRPDGLVRWVWVRAFHILNQAGFPERVAGIAEDVTERKLAQTEILNALAKEKELGDLKSRFISITSHEFRTPLTTIMSTAELLEYYEWTKEDQVEQLHLIQDAVGHLLQLLDDLLFIGIAEAGQVRFNPEPLVLNEFCQELVAEIQRGISLKATATGIQHTLSLVCYGQSFLACMDKKLLRQLLSNLLINAIKYSPRGGQIRFELTCQDDKAIFKIQDQGIGIPREDQHRLFEFFYRAKNVGAIAGTGLGLAIVKTCVDLHRGEITVNSEVQVGTQFTVSLPLKNHFSLPMLGTLPPHAADPHDRQTQATSQIS